MKAYLYLSKKSWAEPWIEGGYIPINLASTYKSEIRDGIYTPDENNIRRLDNLDEERFERIAKIGDSGIGKGSSIRIKVGKYIEGGKTIATDIDFNAYYDDGYVVSFSQTCHKGLMERLNKEVCVEINDVNKIRRQISSQIGLKGKTRVCAYTSSKNRNHFLKSTKDDWQDEVRIFWKTVTSDPQTPKWVKIKSHMGKIITFD